MTISSSVGRALNVEKIVLRAYNLAGLASAQYGTTNSAEWDARLSMAMDMLELDIDSLQAEGIFARNVDFYDLAVTAGTASYSVDSETLDLVGTGMFLADGETTGATPVVLEQRETYHTLSDKAAQGRPHLYYLHRQPTLTVYLYPVPDESGTITFQRHRLTADVNDGEATPDLGLYWGAYLVWQLAHYLANAHSLPVQRCNYLMSQAEYKLDRAKAYAHQRGGNQIHYGHRTPWS